MDARTLLALLAAVGLAGCLGSGQEGGFAVLTLDHLPSPTPPPLSIPVNVTDRDRVAYPVLDTLLGEWEAGGGRVAGVSEPYPLQEGLRLVQELQAREPSGHYRAGTVRLAYAGEVFELSAIDEAHA